MSIRRTEQRRQGICTPEFFAAELRDARERAGMTQAQLAALLPCDRSLVSRIEFSERVPQEDFALACDPLLGTGGLLHRIWKKVAWHQEVDHPDWFRRFADMEAKAVTLCEYQVNRITGLLQTPAYARALFARVDPTATPEQLDDRVAVRLARQRRFLDDTDTPMLIVVLDEAVIRRLVGGAGVMYEQLGHLLKVGRRPNIIVQVAPLSLGECTPSAGSMTLLTMPDGARWTYSESMNRGHFGNDPDQLARRSRDYDRLRADALSAPESTRFIRRVMEGLVNMSRREPDLSTAHWFKSAHSEGDGGQCIEIAYDFLADDAVPVRDSKDPDGPALVFPVAAWRAFVADAARGRFGTV